MKMRFMIMVSGWELEPFIEIEADQAWKGSDVLSLRGLNMGRWVYRIESS